MGVLCFLLLAGWRAGKQRCSPLTDSWFCFSFWFLSGPAQPGLPELSCNSCWKTLSLWLRRCCSQALWRFLLLLRRFLANISVSDVLIPADSSAYYFTPLTQDCSEQITTIRWRWIHKVLFREVFRLEISESAANVIYKKVNLLLRHLDCPFLNNVWHCNSKEWDIKTLLEDENFPRIIFSFPPTELPVLCRSQLWQALRCCILLRFVCTGR